jgi:TatD DNase family protein
MFIDTHTHLYDEQFDSDRLEMTERAINAGVAKMFLPNCDSGTLNAMWELCTAFPENCFPMIGLHPCSVNDNYKEELDLVEKELAARKYYSVGEVGLDYYWDTTFVKEQKKAFDLQISWALQYDLPVIIHTRASIPDGIKMIADRQNGNLRGIFHCFGGTVDEAKQIIDLGFHLGIGGVATFKKSTLPEVLQAIDLEHIVLETDAPYLAPVPYRGKRNESAYIPLIAQKIADIKAC